MAGDIGTDGAITMVGGEVVAITMVGGTIAIGADPTNQARRSRPTRRLLHRSLRRFELCPNQ
jgi:hypothetical protein